MMVAFVAYQSEAQSTIQFGFDGLPLGTVLGEQFSELGVHFAGDGRYQYHSVIVAPPFPQPPAVHVAYSFPADVAEVVRKRGSYSYYLPTFFIFPLPWRYPAFARRVARDVEQALVWFDGYGTPQRCLEQLKSGISALGDARPAGAYARALSFLEHEIGKATD